MSRKPERLVRDVMSSQVVTVVPEMTLREALQTLLEAGVRTAPVLDRSGKTVGVLSQDEVLRRTLDSAEGELDRARVAEAMDAPRLVVGPAHTIPALLRGFLEERQRRALVMENGILLGVVTPVDALRGVAGD